jgi:hypothetical protein
VALHRHNRQPRMAKKPVYGPIPSNPLNNVIVSACACIPQVKQEITAISTSVNAPPRIGCPQFLGGIIGRLNHDQNVVCGDHVRRGHPAASSIQRRAATKADSHPGAVCQNITRERSQLNF